jgi:hypothetical protein
VAPRTGTGVHELGAEAAQVGAAREAVEEAVRGGGDARVVRVGGEEEQVVVELEQARGARQRRGIERSEQRELALGGVATGVEPAGEQPSEHGRGAGGSTGAGGHGPGGSSPGPPFGGNGPAGGYALGWAAPRWTNGPSASVPR